MKKRFVIDLNLCTGCRACMVACMTENQRAPGQGFRNVHTYNEPHLPDRSRYFLSMACNHCESPACVDACPTRACSRDENTGRVTIDPDQCMGCGYCEWACAYGAPIYDETAGVMTKCTFCATRQDEGKEPACAHLCPTGALKADDGIPAIEEMKPVPGIPETDNIPRIAFRPLHHETPECTAIPDPAGISRQFAEQEFARPSRITLKEEWPLALFTFLTAILCALQAGALLTGLAVSPAIFVALGAANLILGTLHLGQKRNAVYAGANMRRSWLSREIVLYGLFLGFSILWLFPFREIAIIGWIAAIAGVTCLIAMDRIYDITLKAAPFPIHSAGALLTSLFLTAVFTQSPITAASLGAIKLLLYVARKAYFLNSGQNVRPGPTVLRLGSGIAAAMLFFTPMAGFIFALISEAVDRGEFYEEQDIQSARMGSF